MTADQAFIEARNLVAEFDRRRLHIQNLTLYDLGLGAFGGYAATFHDPVDLELMNHDWENWFEAADEFPRTAHGKTVDEAIEKAIYKTMAEIGAVKAAA